MGESTVNRTVQYNNHRKYQHVQLRPLLITLENLSISLQKKDIETGETFRKEFTELKELIDEIRLRLD
jgi:hypothetical protein